MPEDLCSDPVTGVLHSKLGLGAAAELQAAEREITHGTLILLDESPVPPAMTYLTCGRSICQQIRTVAIARSAMFCLPQYIDSSAASSSAFGKTACAALHRDGFAGRLAYYLGEVNALHPFREGNRRAQRAFFAQLARDAEFTLAWQYLDAVRNVEASVAIMRGDPGPMREMLGALVRDYT
jgi:cell filamentation protein